VNDLASDLVWNFLENGVVAPKVYNQDAASPVPSYADPNSEETEEHKACGTEADVEFSKTAGLTVAIGCAYRIRAVCGHNL
jgi:hypothetical protein